MKTNNVLGILGGVAVGAALGILFAPEKGSKTRKIKNKAIDTKENLQDTVTTLLDNVKENISTLKSKGEDLLQEGKSKLENSIK